MTQDQSVMLGGFYVFGFLALIVGGIWWLNRQFGERFRYNQRRRQIETAMHLDAFDRSIADDVADEWGYDPRSYRRR
ncbi:hypothetical protein QWJ26_26500 [Streptomyces sp. CSDS2]|uniref:hypothetical protein n=1 Tax=Streptomyces sp. CSDS2 TaxID=3055051 RepID=UPI0025B011FB|nr:hypothetical protein [Streptomyces sp. CSDS2]MDN3263296.1 hypothetical protein [Streptomyces sp. CSDS2]